MGDRDPVQAMQEIRAAMALNGYSQALMEYGNVATFHKYPVFGRVQVVTNQENIVLRAHRRNILNEAAQVLREARIVQETPAEPQ